jgi:hypothetical protein
VARGPCAASRTGAGVLRDSSRCDGHWSCAQFHAPRSDQSLVLECRDQWRNSGPDHGDDHAVGLASARHGPIYAGTGTQITWMDGHGSDDGGGHRHVRDLGKLTWRQVQAEVLSEGCKSERFARGPQPQSDLRSRSHKRHSLDRSECKHPQSRFPPLDAPPDDRTLRDCTGCPTSYLGDRVNTRNLQAPGTANRELRSR